jgi:hypothetical protein
MLNFRNAVLASRRGSYASLGEIGSSVWTTILETRLSSLSRCGTMMNRGNASFRLFAQTLTVSGKEKEIWDPSGKGP